MKLSKEKIFEICKFVADELSFDKFLIFAVVMTESSGNTKADSGYARGLMQVSKIALEDIKKKYNMKYTYDDLFEPFINLEIGTLYLMNLYNYFSAKGFGEFAIIATLLAYSWGIGNVKKWLEKTEPDNRFIDESVLQSKKDYIFNIFFWYYYAKNKFKDMQ
ncbi:transglycosylase SLT domain-containing protein [Marinitoga sp. 1137]|uniref:transglycosylase SLT domain-containing protein n=1 Tax=Marinitoga sp. 1137 TaxID=1545835 RepID=UPI000950EA06|nr:transglycosylase SLT domain-containing protein [Marinitoga sp. 1137]